MSITAVPGGVRIEIHVQPGASRSEVAGLHGARIKVRIKSPPIEGRANAAVIAWMAEQLGVPRRAVHLIRGDKSREKMIEVEGVTVEQAREKLES